MYLRQFGVPFEALAYVFGRNAMYWYRIYLSLGRASIVGATIKDAQKLPQHLVADEKHTWLAGKRVDLPTTVAEGCILGVGFTESASGKALTKGYQEFQPCCSSSQSELRPSNCQHRCLGWDTTGLAGAVPHCHTGVMFSSCGAESAERES